MSKLTDWPELDEMNEKELRELVSLVRDGLHSTDDARGLAVYLAELLKVDTSPEHE